MDAILEESVGKSLVVENSQLRVTLREGLIGCEMWREFALEAPPDLAPLMYLHSLDQTDLTFIVTHPRYILPSYQVDLSESDKADLGNPTPAELATVVIVNSARRGEGQIVTANLLGPIVINLTTGSGRQIIQPEYSAHHLLSETPVC